MILNGNLTWKLVVILSLLIPKVYSQSEVESLLDPVRQYAAPVIEGTVGNLSSGWMQRSPRAKMLGLDVEFGIIGMGTVFGQSDKTFSSNVNVKLTEATIDAIVSNISDPQLREAVKESLRDAKLRVSVSGPTVIGSNTETIKFHYPGDTISFSYAGQYHTVALKEVYEDTKITGINFPLVPLAALQGSIGTFAGTKLLLRTIPPIDLGSNNGKIFYIGGGLQHNPMVWFSKKPPLDASVGFIIYKMNVGSVFKSFGMQTGLSVSKTFGMTMLEFTPFLGFNIDYNKSKIHYLYEYTDEAGQRQSYLLDLDLHEHTGVRFNTGFELKAAIMNFSFNYSYEKYHSFSGGIGFIF